MKRYTLEQWLKLEPKSEHTQTILAEAVGLSQGAISQALASVKRGEKQAFVVVGDNSMTLEYVKSPRARDAAA